VVVGGAAVTGAIVGSLTTALPVAVLYLFVEFSSECYPWQTSGQVWVVLQAVGPGLVAGILWGIMAGLTTRWMANRMGGRAGLGCLGALLLVSLLVAVVVALMWFVWVVFNLCP
jgi:hypothetical protein